MNDSQQTITIHSIRQDWASEEEEEENSWQKVLGSDDNSKKRKSKVVPENKTNVIKKAKPPLHTTSPPPARCEPSVPPESKFVSPNPFAPLASIQNEKPEPSATNPKLYKPPPVFVKNIKNYVELCEILNNLLGPDSFVCKSRLNDIMISPKTVEAYRKIVTYFRKSNSEFHTYQLKEEKSYRVVIRHLHHSTPIELIKEEIEKLGFPVRAVMNVVQPISRTPLPLFFVDLEPKPNNPEIFSITSILHTKIKIEEPHKSREIIQCKRCQSYGHSRAYCNHNPRCVKCAGDHSSEICNKTREIPATCVLCMGNHPANYRGCSVHLELQRLRRHGKLETPGGLDAKRSYQEVRNQPIPPPLTSPAYPQLSTSQSRASPPQTAVSPQQSSTAYKASYAEIAGQSATQQGQQILHIPRPPNSNDMTSLLTSFLSDFKTLITPLITLLTTVVTQLLQKPQK